MFKLSIIFLLVNILFADVFDEAGPYVPPASKHSNHHNYKFHTVIIDSHNNIIHDTRHRKRNKLFYGLSIGDIYTIKRARLNSHNQWIWTSRHIRFNGDNINGYSYMDLEAYNLHRDLEKSHQDKLLYKDLLNTCNSKKEYLNEELSKCKSKLTNTEDDYYSKLISTKTHMIDHKGIKIELMLPKKIKTPFDIKINGYKYTIK